MDELDVESTELTDILVFDTEHKGEFETLLVDEEENYQRDVKSLLKLFVDIITPSHSALFPIWQTVAFITIDCLLSDLSRILCQGWSLTSTLDLVTQG